MTIDLTPIVQALISLLALFITSKVIPWLKAKTSVQQQAALMSAARIAVYAAEQVYGSGHGQEKMAYAQKWLMDKGYALDMAAIEAAVREMNIESLGAVENAYKNPSFSEYDTPPIDC